jgi:Tfp pilus assembly protein PilN
VAPPGPARQFLELLAPSLHVPTSIEDPLPESTLPAANAPFELLPMVHQASVSAAGGAAAAMGLIAGLPPVNIAWESAAARRAQPKAITVASIAGSTLWLVGALGVTAVLYLVGAGLQRDSAQLDRRIQALRAERAPLVRREALGRAALAQQTKSGVPAGSVRGRVAVSTNDRIQLSRLDVQPAGKLSIEGRAGSTRGLEQFTRELGQGQSIHSPVIESLKQDPGGLVSFRVTASYPYTPPPTTTAKE